MKAVLCFLLLVAIARGEPGTTSVESGAVHSRLSEELKRQFRFDPQPAVERSVGSEDAVILPRFYVNDFLRGVESAVRHEQTKREDEIFSWQKGGTLLKHVGKTATAEIMFKYDLDRNVLDLIKISW